MGVKVLSLFDGMACGMLAMQKAGIAVDEYIAYEIDKYAIQTAKHNFPKIQESGDVFTADFTKHKGIDYLVGGSPCTYWSIAQMNNRETEASGVGWDLFTQYVRAIREAQPEYFIYENNKSMSSAIKDSITKEFGFEPICINSALVSAQNRQRLYWVGKRRADGTYSKVAIEQPCDAGICVKDVICGACLNTVGEDKCKCIRASMYKDGIRNLVGNNVDKRTCVAEAVIWQRGHGYNAGGIKETKAPTLTANGSWQYNNFISTQVLMADEKAHNEPCKVGEINVEGQGNQIYAVEGKAVTLTANSVGLGTNMGLYAIPVEYCAGKPKKAVSIADGKIYKVYTVKDSKLKLHKNEYTVKLNDGYYIFRKLTVEECKRLQTVPEWYTFPVSDTQAYKQLGNGWTVDVIAHILRATTDSV